MKRNFKQLLAAGLLLIISSQAMAWQSYSQAKDIDRRIETLQKNNPKLIHADILTKSTKGNNVWAITIGGENYQQKPAVAVVAGVDPRHMVGIETALQFAEKMAKDPQLEELLKVETFYIFPCINPDALEGYFATNGIQQEISRTLSLYDNDRDGLMSEDPAEDLNNDGIISTMIVKSPNGKYIKHPNDPRVVILADKSKGQKGEYLLLSEGIDNDKDGQINEDGADGVNLNQNFTYKYKNWTSEGGSIAVSELESRALLDFMYQQFNIHSVFVLGQNDNLASPQKYSSRHRKAVKMNQDVSPEIQKHLVADNAIAGRASEIFKNNNPKANNYMAIEPLGGNFMEWAYYHFGRNSFATTVWTVDKQDELKSREAAYLKWAEAQGIENVVKEWETIKDFGDEIVELGSLNPYAMFAPPLELIQDQIDATHTSILDIAALAPRIELDKIKVEKLKKNLYRVRAMVVNSGEMSTATSTGVQSQFVKYIRAELKLDDQKVLSGTRLLTIPSLEAGEGSTISWLIQGSGNITLEAGCPQAGFVSKSLTLK